MHETDKIGVQIIVHGLVQGVCFRAYTQATAIKLNTTGQVCNLPDGTVKIIAYGSETNINEFIKFMKIGPEHSRVDNLSLTYLPFSEVFDDFQIFR